jgi:hypothetical protein
MESRLSLCPRQASLLPKIALQNPSTLCSRKSSPKRASLPLLTVVGCWAETSICVTRDKKEANRIREECDTVVYSSLSSWTPTAGSLFRVQ